MAEAPKLNRDFDIKYIILDHVYEDGSDSAFDFEQNHKTAQDDCLLLIGLFRHADLFHHSLASCCCGGEVLPGSDIQMSPGQGMGHDNIQSSTSPFLLTRG